MVNCVFLFENNKNLGGLSSFTLFLLVLAYTKIFRNKSYMALYYGVFLIEFFNFYANFDFQYYQIDVNMEMYKTIYFTFILLFMCHFLSFKLGPSFRLLKSLIIFQLFGIPLILN